MLRVRGSRDGHADTLADLNVAWGCRETVCKSRLALRECLDGRQPTRRSVSSLTCRVEVSELAAELEWAPDTALPSVLGRAVAR